MSHSNYQGRSNTAPQAMRGSGISGILYNFFLKIRRELNLEDDEVRMHYLMDKYVRTQAPVFEKTRDISSVPGNLNKDFARRKMTWKAFCRTLSFFGVTGFTLKIHATYSNGKTYEHSTFVDLRELHVIGSNGKLTMNDSVMHALQRLKGAMFADMGIGVLESIQLMNSFVQYESRNVHNQRDMSGVRGSISKEFRKDTMTWRVFCRVMMFMQIVRFRMIVQAYYEDGVERTHVSEVIGFNTVEQYLVNNEELIYKSTKG
jgi:hypothetical protein